MKLTTHAAAPIAEIIREAEGLFQLKYGIKSERIHCSRPFAKALVRYIAKVLYNGSVPKGEAVEYEGREVLLKTKASPHFEFDLSATRDGQVMSINTRVQPKHVTDGNIIVSEFEGVIQLGEESDGTPDLELLDSASELSAEEIESLKADKPGQSDNEPT